MSYDYTLYVYASFQMKLNICPDEALGRAPDEHVTQRLLLWGDTRGMHDEGNLFFFLCGFEVCPRQLHQGLDWEGGMLQQGLVGEGGTWPAFISSKTARSSACIY